jgi:hypothetical protein
VIPRYTGGSMTDSAFSGSPTEANFVTPDWQ